LPEEAMEKLRFPLEFKQIGEDGSFEGLAAVYGTLDRVGDIIRRGAFKKTVSERPEKPILWMHQVFDVPIGKGTLSDSEKGLQVAGQLDLEQQRAREIRSAMKLGTVRGLSIGYEPIKWSWDGEIRVLDEIRVDEISLVTDGFQAHSGAVVNSVKTAVPFQDLPLADENRAWDAAAATKRVRTWAGADEAPNEKYRQAFLWYDADNVDQFGAYKFPIADVIDGTLKAVPRAIYAAAGRLNQADIPENDIPKLRRHLERYYDKLGQESPFEDDGKALKDEADLERLLRQLLSQGAVMGTKMKAGHVLSRHLRQFMIAAREPLQALIDAAAKQEEKTTADREPDIHSLLQDVGRKVTEFRETLKGVA
jgi:HK97 family phage prohead protease